MGDIKVDEAVARRLWDKFDTMNQYLLDEIMLKLLEDTEDTLGSCKGKYADKLCEVSKITFVSTYNNFTTQTWWMSQSLQQSAKAMLGIDVLRPPDNK